ncbi:hypothetical protein QJQ08_00100 [Chlamydia suis]|nr:hypothetical protein [Chlamydia suis]MEB2694224.1 hypothetical protein [Chlamydia suis]
MLRLLQSSQRASVDATTGEISGSAKATSNQTTYTVNVTDANLSRDLL